jgi:WXG100 family type VII secretion target
MSGQIRITPDVMRQRAGQYRSEAAEVNGVISRMDSLLNSLQSEWEGQASQSYAQRYTELKPGFQKAEELINEIAQALDKVATQLEQTDASIASAFRA